MTVIPQEPLQFAHVPDSDAYVLADCSVPRACLRGADWADGVSADDLLRCNIHIQDGRIRALTPVSEAGEQSVVRLDGACVFPAFVDLHTHIGAGTAPATWCLQGGMPLLESFHWTALATPACARTCAWPFRAHPQVV